MNDGWDDDDDLGLDRLDSMEDDANGKPKDDEKDVGDQQGWDYNDDDIDIDNINHDEDGGNNEDSTNLEYSWGESDNWKPGNGLSIPTEASSTSNPTPASDGQSGWEEDEELFGEDEVDDDDNKDENITSRDYPGVAITAPSTRNLLQELQDYVESLDRIASSINAVLEYEYNTPEKAQELLDYYSARPGLAEYTRTKELPRMNYQVVLPNGRVETSKEQIALHHLPDHSLMARCANQSLLADLIHVLTGPDLVVRPQFLAICVAQTCQFRLHMGDPGRDMVQCNCMMQLSLPVAEGPRLNIATLRSTVIFSPHQPMVKFNVDKIIVMLKDYSKLQPVVAFLNMMEGHFQELPGHEDLALQNAPADIFRDAFLEQTHHLMNQSKEGFKSALQDMESVLGLQSKLKAVRGGLSKFLPDTQAILAAEEEAQALATRRQQQQQQAPPPTIRGGFGQFLPDTQIILAAEEEARTLVASQQERHSPPPPLPPVRSGMANVVPDTHARFTAGQDHAPIMALPRDYHHPQQQHGPPNTRPPPPPPPESRPQSILGGLVKTGWSALAKSVMIPDDDPAIYGAAPPPPPPPMIVHPTMKDPATNNRDNTPTGPLHLYHRPPEPGPIPNSDTSKTSPFMPLPVPASTFVAPTAPPNVYDDDDELPVVAKTSFDARFGDDNENETDNNDNNHESNWNEQFQSSTLDPDTDTNPDLHAQDDGDVVDGWGDDDDLELDEVASNDAMMDTQVAENDNHDDDDDDDNSQNTDSILNAIEDSVDDHPKTLSVPNEATDTSLLPETTVEPVAEESLSLVVVDKATDPPKNNHPKPVSPLVQVSPPRITSSSIPVQKDTTATTVTISSGQSSTIHQPWQRVLEVVDMDYNPEEDILPTRQRWVNPRPNRSYLFQ